MQRVLVPFDMSANAVTALDYALKFCSFYGISLFVFHVSDKSPYLLALGAGEAELERRILQDHQEKEDAIRQTIAERCQVLGISFPDEKITVKAEHNPLVVEKIIEVAGKNHADMIIMGTHGATGMKKFLFGSNTSAMISKSLIPVLAIPEKYVYRPLSRIVYASDLEKLKAELGYITTLLRGIHPAVEIVHFDFGLDMSNLSTGEMEKIIAATGYSPIQMVIKKSEIDKSLLKHIREYIRQTSPGWMVMFTRERSFWQKLFAGSKTEDMAYALEMPLLSLRKPE